MIGPINSVSALSFTREIDGLSTTTRSALGQSQGAQQAGPSFETTLSSLASGVASNLRHAEGMSFAGIMGQADTRQVVDAVMTAEQSLQTAIAIRDKIVSAYLEISRIQI